jgi:site-specific recombinase XerD
MSRGFAYRVEDYFAVYLPMQLGASANTRKSYRDTFVQMLGYIESEHHIRPGKITFETLTAELVEQFLLYLEASKGIGISTRNQRLAAIHSFVRYLQRKELSCFDRCSAILAIPFKKAPKPMMAWLSIREMEILLSLPDGSRKGLRDLAILTTMYESGARVQELIDLSVSSLHLSPDSFYIDLRGKGNKARRVPIGGDAADILGKYVNAFRIADMSSSSVFANNRGQRLTRAGVQHILDKYVSKARALRPDLFRQKYTNHSLRHSKAMHLLEAGVNLIYIRDFLGHSSVTTTEIYAKTNPDIKRKIITENAMAGVAAGRYDEDEREDLLSWLKDNL